MVTSIKFSENFLYHIWDAQHFQRGLKTISDESISVMFCGNWNTDEGPDFKNAVIKIGDEVLRGDVEIHLNTYDWIAHKHNDNPTFNNVILHVVYNHNGKYSHTICENGKKIEILQLKNNLDEEVSKLLQKYEPKKFLETDRDCSFFASNNAEQLLYNLGFERFEKKIKRFSAELHFSDFNQIFMQGLFEALGYSKNKQQLLQLALEYKYSDLKKYKEAGMSKDELISILLCSSDLVNHLPVSFAPEYKLKWSELYTKQNFAKKHLDINWKLFRIRPVNHPAVRVVQLAELLYDKIGTSLFNELLKIFSFSEDEFKLNLFKRKLYNFFDVQIAFLPENYRIGKSRIDIVLINIILPLIVLYSRKMVYPELEKTALKVYAEYKGLQRNAVISSMEKFMNDAQIKVVRKKAITQQGILALYYNFCLHHNCRLCELNRDDLVGEM